MAHVKALFDVEECWQDEYGNWYCYPVKNFVEGDYKKVIWDGESLTIGRRKITIKVTNGFGKYDIEYLEIDGKVFRDVRPETLERKEKESKERLDNLFKLIKESKKK